MTLAEGMDVERVRHIAAELGRNGENLREVRGAGSASMHVLGDVWQGEDLEHFAREWQVSAGRLEAAALSLRQAHAALLAQADDQTETSSGAGGGGAGDRLEDLVDRVVDVFDDLFDGSETGWAEPEPGLTDRLGDAWDWVTDRGEDAWDWATDRADDVVEWGRDGLDWAGDRARGAWDAVTDFWDEEVVSRWDAGLAALERLGPSIENFAGQFTQIFTEGRWPRFHEVLTSAILLLGRGVGLGANVLTGEDHQLFDSGTGVASPTRQIPGDLGAPGTVPNDLNGVMDMMTAAYDDTPSSQRHIRITEVAQPDGSTAYIVTVPGTNGMEQFPGSINGSPEAFDNTSNLELQAGMRSASMEAIVDAMEQHGIPQDAPVMLHGHSQGGMAVAELTQDEGFMNDYNVTHMITQGAPNDSRSIPSSVQTLAIEHTNDPVPMVDFGDALLGPPVAIPTPGPLPPVILPMTPIPNFDPALAGSGPHVTQLQLDPEPGVGMFADREHHAHNYTNYADTIARELDAGNPALDRYLDANGGRGGDVPIDVYLTGVPDDVSTTEYETRRE